MWCWRRLLSVPWTVRRSNQSILKEINPWIFVGRTDAEAEAPIFWPPDAKSWLIRKDPDAGKDWGQEEIGATEDEMVRWHHQFNGHEFAHSRRWWRTRKAGVLQSMGLQRVGHNWVTKQQQASQATHLETYFSVWKPPNCSNCCRVREFGQVTILLVV